MILYIDYCRLTGRGNGCTRGRKNNNNQKNNQETIKWTEQKGKTPKTNGQNWVIKVIWGQSRVLIIEKTIETGRKKHMKHWQKKAKSTFIGFLCRQSRVLIIEKTIEKNTGNINRKKVKNTFIGFLCRQSRVLVIEKIMKREESKNNYRNRRKALLSVFSTGRAGCW